MTNSPGMITALRGSAVLLVLFPSLSYGASGPKRLPVCNGKHLRDVNIHGSVLPGSPIPAVTAPPAPPPVPQIKPPLGGEIPPPPPVPNSASETASALADAESYRNC